MITLLIICFLETFFLLVFFLLLLLSRHFYGFLVAQIGCCCCCYSILIDLYLCEYNTKLWSFSKNDEKKNKWKKSENGKLDKKNLISWVRWRKKRNECSNRKAKEKKRKRIWKVQNNEKTITKIEDSKIKSVILVFIIYIDG